MLRVQYKTCWDEKTPLENNHELNDVSSNMLTSNFTKVTTTSKAWHHTISQDDLPLVLKDNTKQGLVIFRYIRA